MANLRDEPEKKPRWRPAPIANARPPEKTPAPKRDTRVEDAKNALANFWATSGDIGISEAAEACRKLTVPELRLVRAWLPQGQGLTEQKCNRARIVVDGVIGEKA